MLGKAKKMNRFEMVGVESEALKILNEVFDLELDDLGTIYSDKKFHIDEDTFDSKFGKAKAVYLDEVNNIIFQFECAETEEDKGSYYVDMIQWKTTFENPFKLIENEC